MERSNYLAWIFEHLPNSTFASISLVVVTLLYLSYIFVFPDPEAAIDYNIKAQEACQAGLKLNREILSSPSIQVPGSTLIQCYSPADGKLLGRVNPATAEGIDRAISKAAEAQIEWARTSFAQRRKVLNTLLKYVLEHQDEIVRAACLDSGKTRIDAAFGELLVTAEKLAWTVKHGEKALRTSRRPTNLLMCYKVNEVRYEPLGVVAAAVSWNYPFHNLLNPIISSLFTGNAIVVKSSEQTAWSASYFISIVRGALTANKHSASLVQSIICWPSVAPHLTSHPLISHLTFIGSRPIAHAVAASAAKALIPVCAELGGKDAAIILDDVSDIEKVASILMRGVFQSAGQNCIGIERVIATPAAYDRLLSIIPPRVRALRQGNALEDEDDVDVGASVSPASFDNLEQLIADAVSRGAELLCGGQQYVHPQWPKGHYFAPTLLVGVTRDMPVAQHELFAPVFVMMRASSVDDAIAIANSTAYALGGSVFGSSRADLHRISRDINAGMVSINDFASYYMASLPFGGVKGSGYGRFGGAEGLRSLCNAKSVNYDRFGSLVSTSIPPRLDYARDEAERLKARPGSKSKAWEFVKGIVEVGYGIGVTGRVGGLRKILGNL